MVKPNQVYLGLGSNQGDRKNNLQTAINEIAGVEGIIITETSSLYLTEPWGKKDQDEFFNQVIEIETQLSAVDLLKALQKIEIKMGRQRLGKWGPRNIDIDIILYGQEIVDSTDLKIPHPYAQQRLFVLIPLQEINTEIVFPDSGMKIGEVLIRALGREDDKGIKKLN